ncbi:MAG: DUF488 domain-containing protein [Deinococcota bacterium]|jgi:uncharacterized protein (DUF488 family)|nr:DUF488 domain-containing protein [Deinococcota bacterium]
MAVPQAYTIGFTQKSAAAFFDLLRQQGIRRLLDVRINNTSRLAGFTRKEDLAFFLRELCEAEYVHEPLLAPTKDLLKRYRDGDISWSDYENEFLTLMRERQVEEHIAPQLFDVPTVLLCSEATPEQCHRRLVLEYLGQAWGDLDIIHL